MQTAELNIFISQVERIIYEMRSPAGFRLCFRSVIVLFCFSFSVNVCKFIHGLQGRLAKLIKVSLRFLIKFGGPGLCKYHK